MPQAARAAYEEEVRRDFATQPADQLCATPFGVDVVGITEFIALTGALVGGASAYGGGAAGATAGLGLGLGRPEEQHRSMTPGMQPGMAAQPLTLRVLCPPVWWLCRRRERAAAEAGAGAVERAAAHHQHAAEVRAGPLPTPSPPLPPSRLPASINC